MEDDQQSIEELKVINAILTKQVVRMTLAIQEHKDQFVPGEETTEDGMLWEVLD